MRSVSRETTGMGVGPGGFHCVRGRLGVLNQISFFGGAIAGFWRMRVDVKVVGEAL